MPIHIKPIKPHDAIIISLDPGGPVELTGLSDSFAALARIYERMPHPEGEAKPRLYVTRLTTGSIIAEIAPYIQMFGQPALQAMSTANTLGNFAKRVSDGIKAFAGITTAKSISELPAPETSPEGEAEVAALKEFIKPITGRRNASLKIRHARFSKTTPEGEIVVEYTFSEEDINRAALNMERALSLRPSTEADAPSEADKSRFVGEVMLVFESASRKPGKQGGRTKDYAIVSDVTTKPLPTYFRRSVRGNLKEMMVRGVQNPLTEVGYIVDVHVQMREGNPVAYVVTEVYDTVDLTDSDEWNASE